jgi:ABC-type Fe3+-siderophore transport system permease subunit
MSQPETPTSNDTTPGSLQGFDWRTFGIMVGAALVGVAWAAYNYSSTGGQRGEEQLQPLVWTMFATPFALFIGWTIARRFEVWLAAFACFCLYFFTFFVAKRIETLVMTQEEAKDLGYPVYFISAMVLHAVAAVALAVWRARQSPPQTEPADHSEHTERIPDAT